MDSQLRESLVRAATLYYRDELSQQQVAERLGVSRATVSNMLRSARELGIVEIRIREVPSESWELGQALRERYSLQGAIVVPSEPDVESTKMRVGQAAADLLCTLLADDMTIGISWGTTLYQLVTSLSPPQTPAGIEVVQMVGALGSLNPRFDGFELARRLAEKLRCDYRVIQAPHIVGSLALKRMLVREPKIEETLAHARAARLALLGVSSNRPEECALVRAGFLSADEALSIYREGGVGHINGLHFTAEGRFMDCEWNERVIGISAGELLAIPTVIGVAMGAAKVEAIRGALRGGILKTLITDTEAARLLVVEP